MWFDARERPVCLFEGDTFGRHDTVSQVMSTGRQGKSSISNQL
ncbi:hypothetical protein GWL_45920 [Herbaspirillum sp. GW103]|nr:hypothetical protein GWL_45920 [Herbaspirillum sp. GW103]